MMPQCLLSFLLVLIVCIASLSPSGKGSITLKVAKALEKHGLQVGMCQKQKFQVALSFTLTLWLRRGRYLFGLCIILCISHMCVNACWFLSWLPSPQVSSHHPTFRPFVSALCWMNRFRQNSCCNWWTLLSYRYLSDISWYRREHGSSTVHAQNWKALDQSSCTKRDSAQPSRSVCVFVSVHNPLCTSTWCVW